MSVKQGQTQGGIGGVGPPLKDLGGVKQPLPPVTNQTIIPYPKPLKHSNKTKLRLNESKNNSLDIFPYHYNSF